MSQDSREKFGVRARSALAGGWGEGEGGRRREKRERIC